MRKILVLAGLLACGASAALAQSTGNQIEIPLRVEGGRLLVPVQGPGGAVYNFTLNLGMTMLSESGATRIGDDLNGLTLGDAPVITEDIATVPDEELAVDGMVFDGVIGSQTLNSFDILIDVPGGRLVLKPIGRSVRWEGMALSNAVPLRVYHGLLLGVDVELEGTVFGGVLDLGPSTLIINEAARAKSGLEGDHVAKFRMGYGTFPDVPVRMRELAIFKGWDPDNNGFVVIGAPVTYDCAIAISWTHAEMRTCLR